jgi:hypothetical protein
LKNQSLFQVISNFPKTSSAVAGGGGEVQESKNANNFVHESKVCLPHFFEAERKKGKNVFLLRLKNFRSSKYFSFTDCAKITISYILGKAGRRQQQLAWRNFLS